MRSPAAVGQSGELDLQAGPTAMPSRRGPYGETARGRESREEALTPALSLLAEGEGANAVVRGSPRAPSPARAGEGWGEGHGFRG
jgi:hypothetical protein